MYVLISNDNNSMKNKFYERRNVQVVGKIAGANPFKPVWQVYYIRRLLNCKIDVFELNGLVEAVNL